MAKRVSVDGRIFVVPDDATPDEIDQISRGSSAPARPTTPPPAPNSMGLANQALASNPKSAGLTVAPLQPPSNITRANVPGVKPMASAAPPAQGSSLVPNWVIDAAKGIGEGAVQTGTSLSPLINKIPKVGETLAPSAGIAGAKELARPVNGTQAVGKTAEQIGEWFLPTGLEEKAGVYGAKALGAIAPHAPNLFAKAAPLVAKAGAAALESGVRNMSQGGDFKTGAYAGAAGTLASPVLKSAANTVADIAMRPGVRILKSAPEGVQKIGQTVLENSTADKPELIAKQLQGKITGAANAKNALLDTAKQQGVTGSLAPARNLYQSELQSAVKQNAPEYIKDVNKVGDQLKYEFGAGGKPVMASAAPPTRPGAGFIPTVQVPTGAPMAPKTLPAAVDPVRLQAIKEGIGKTIGNFNPEAQAAIDPFKERVYGALTGEIHNAVPGTGALDQQMTNLFPAQKAANNVAFHPDLAHSVANRVARATGALAASTGGAYAGYKEGGAPGAVIGGGIGLVAPEMISSPTGQMFMARRFASPNTINLFKGAGLQFDRPSANKK
jgi:hypothetical protein